MSLADQLKKVESFIEADQYSSALSLLDGLLRSFKEFPSSGGQLFQIRLALLDCAPGVWNEMYSAEFAVGDYGFDFISEMSALEKSYISKGNRLEAVKIWESVAEWMHGSIACNAVIAALSVAPKDLDSDIVERLECLYTENFWKLGYHVKDIQNLKKMCAEYMDFEVILHAFGRGLDFQDLIDWITEVDWYDQYLIDTIEQIKRRFPYVEISFDRELGIANLEVGNYEGAVEIFSRMLLEDEDQFDVLAWLGRSFANGGSPNIGRILLNEVLRRSKPDSEEFKEALAALDEIIAADDLINLRKGGTIS